MKTILLRGARVALGPESAETLDVEVGSRGIIHMAPRLEARDDTSAIDLDGHLVLPGLVNAHDHLEFNLFPRLGHGLYRNATEWARDIYHPEASPIRENLTLPRKARLFWGGLKNLLSGVTTVWHHNPPDPSLYAPQFPVRVVRRFGWAHSLAFTPDLAGRFRATPKPRPFVIHAAEGIDDCARGEIPQLDEMGCLDSRTILVHAVAAGDPELAIVRARGASLVWCPSSNLFLFGRTLRLPAFDLNVALGSDSALTAAGDFLDEIHTAGAPGLVPYERIYQMVAKSPRDLIAIRDCGGTPAQVLMRTRGPVLSIIRGRVRLAAPGLLRRPRGHWSQIDIEGRPTVLVPFSLAPLCEATTSALGSVWRLAGRQLQIRSVDHR